MAIIDIAMPNLRGIEAAREIKMSHPRTKVLILTMHKSKEYLYHSISAGADGYLLKEDSDVELLSAIDKIRNGETYVTRILAGEMAEDLSQIYRGKRPIPKEPLTTREREILKMVSEGKSNNETAALLSISPRTVENHRANIIFSLLTSSFSLTLNVFPKRIAPPIASKFKATNSISHNPILRFQLPYVLCNFWKFHNMATNLHFFTSRVHHKIWGME